MNNLHTLLINEVPAIQSQLASINRGGCAIFAHQLHLALASRGIASDIVLVEYSWYDADDVNSMLVAHNTTDINEVYMDELIEYVSDEFDPCIGHLCVAVGGKLYDDSGVVSHTIISDPIDADVAELLVEKVSWNPTFLDSNSCDMKGAQAIMSSFFTNVFSNLTDSEVVA